MARISMRSNRKFMRLCRDIQRPPYQVRGLLEMMWESAHENEPTFPTLDDAEIVSTWDGELGVFGKALVDSGFLDEVAGGYFIHDYWQHAPQWVKDREKKRKQRGQAGDTAGTTGGQAGDKTSHGGSSVAKRSVEKPSVAKAKEESGTDVPEDSSELPGTKASKPEPAPDSILFECVGKTDPERTYELTKAFMDELQSVYTGIDVHREALKARLWLKTNPTKKKTAKGMPTFLNKWMTRATNDGRSSGGGSGSSRISQIARDKGHVEYRPVVEDESNPFYIKSIVGLEPEEAERIGAEREAAKAAEGATV